MHPNLYALGAILCWASLPAATGNGLDGLSVTELLVFSFVPAALYLVAQAMMLQRSWRIPVPSWRLSLLGIVGIFGYHWVYYLALDRAPVIEGAILATTWSFWIVVFSSVLERRRLPLPVAGFACLGMYGAYLVIAGGRGIHFEARHMVGYALALLCGFIWSGFSVALGRCRPEHDYMPIFTVYAAIIALCLYAGTGGASLPPARSVGAAVYLGLVPLGLSFTLWNRALSRGNMTVIGYLSYLTPPLAVLLAALVRGAPVSWHALAGMACVLAAAIGGRRCTGA